MEAPIPLEAPVMRATFPASGRGDAGGCWGLEDLSKVLVAEEGWIEFEGAVAVADGWGFDLKNLPRPHIMSLLSY